MLLLDFTNALVDEWEQIPAARFRKLEESFPWRLEAVKLGYSTVLMPVVLHDMFYSQGV